LKTNNVEDKFAYKDQSKIIILKFLIKVHGKL